MDDTAQVRVGSSGGAGAGVQRDMWSELATPGNGPGASANGALCDRCRGELHGNECPQSMLCGERWMRIGSM